jgi:hypothetical protein
MDDVATRAAAHPTTIPATVDSTTCLPTIARTEERLAPSAIRIPISDRRWLTT